MKVGEPNPKVMVEIANEVLDPSQISMDKLAQHIVSYNIGGIEDPAGQLAAWIYEGLSEKQDTVKQALEGYITTTRDKIISEVHSKVRADLEAIIGISLAHSPSLLDRIGEFFGDVKDKIVGAGEWVYDKVKGGIDAVAGVINKIWEFVQQIPGWIANVPALVLDGLGDVGKRIVELFGGMASWLCEKFWDGVTWLGNKIVDGMRWLGGIVIRGLSAFGGFVFDLVKTIGGGLLGLAKGFGDWFSNNIIAPLGGLLDKATAEILRAYGIGSPFIPWGRAMLALAPLMGMVITGSLIKEVADAAGETEFMLFGTKIKPGLAKALKVFDFANIATPLLTGFSMGLGMAMFQGTILDPTRIDSLKAGRPLPSPMSHIEEAYRLGYVSWERLNELAAWHGINPRFMDIEKIAQLKPLTEAPLQLLVGRHLTITPDGQFQLPEEVGKAVLWAYQAQGLRPDIAQLLGKPEVFNAYQKFLAFKLEELMVHPSPSDLIRFRVKEVPLELKTYYEIVKQNAGQLYLNWMKKKGIPEYWALAYWDAHWRWISETGLVDLYFRGELREEWLRRYLYWMDFQPYIRPTMPWQIKVGEKVLKYENDIDIILRYLLRMPEITQGRWMVRWGITGFQNALKDHCRIVIAHRLHEDWVSKVIMAEYAETLTSARTHIVAALERAIRIGAKTPEEFLQLTKAYTLVGVPEQLEVVGKGGNVMQLKLPRQIQLLTPDEAQLETMRIKLDILRDLTDALSDQARYQFVTGLLDLSGLRQKLQQFIRVPEVLEALVARAQADLARTQMTFLRYIVRGVAREIVDLYASGIITRDQAKQIMAKACSPWLAERHIDVALTEADVAIERTLADHQVQAVLRRLSRGAITTQQAKDQLRRILKDDRFVDVLIERYAKVYTVSVDKLVSMREYIPVSIDMIRKKAEAIGIPEDEAKLYIPYAVARTINEELRAIVTEIKNDYLEGIIDEATARRQLDEVATLWGMAKSKLGVDWVLYDPDERALLIEAWKRRKARKEAKRRYRGG